MKEEGFISGNLDLAALWGEGGEDHWIN